MSNLDMRGAVIEVGNCVCYGKGNRDNPVGLGVVKDIIPDKKFPDRVYFEILGQGNTKVGHISSYHSESRILVLPDNYLEEK